MYVSQATHTSRAGRDTYIDTHIHIYHSMGRNVPEVFNIQNSTVPHERTYMSMKDSLADTQNAGLIQFSLRIFLLENTERNKQDRNGTYDLILNF